MTILNNSKSIFIVLNIIFDVNVLTHLESCPVFMFTSKVVFLKRQVDKSTKWSSRWPTIQGVFMVEGITKVYLISNKIHLLQSWQLLIKYCRFLFLSLTYQIQCFLRPHLQKLSNLLSRLNVKGDCDKKINHLCLFSLHPSRRKLFVVMVSIWIERSETPPELEEFVLIFHNFFGT